MTRWRYLLPLLCAMGLWVAAAAAAERDLLGGWLPILPKPEQMLRGQDPAAVQEFQKASSAVLYDPKDTNALVTRAYDEM